MLRVLPSRAVSPARWPAPSRRRRALAGPASAAVIAVVAVVAVLALLGLDAAPAAAKSFELERLVVDATLGTDGDLEVREQVTYDFDGSFTAGIRSFPPATRDRVTGFRASEAGRPLAVIPPRDSISGEWEWEFEAEDEERTFELAYELPGIAAVGPDVAELYWKVVEPEGLSIGRVEVTLHLPTAEDVRAWGHGPPSGRVSIEGDTVRLSTGRVGDGSFVEARVTVPATALDVAPSGEPRLPRILEEEAEWAAARQAELDRSTWANRLSPVAALVAVVAFLVVWWRWGKEPRPPDDIGDYWREPLTDPPAVVMATLRFGTIPNGAFSATLVDLAQRGYLTIREERVERFGPDKVTYHFRRLKSSADLPSWERRLMDRLFAGGDETTMDDLTRWAREHPGTAQEFWKDWQAALRKDLRSRQYVEPVHPLPYLLVGLAALAAIGVGVAALVLGGVVETFNVLGLAPILVGVALLPAMVVLRRRTPLGARKAAEAEALARFLKDFSRLDEAPVASMVVWERYLVDAVALGVAEDLVRNLALRVPEVATNPSFATWYVGSQVLAGHGGGVASGLAGIGSFAVDVGRGAAGAFRPSSSGSGGGFSGGGGGGSGGGSFGAR